MKKDFYLFKRDRFWQVKFRDPASGEILTAVSTGETNRTRADDWCRTRYAELTGKSGKPTDLLRDWAAPFFLGPPGCPRESRRLIDGKPFSLKTRREYRAFLEKDILTDPIADMPLVDIKRSDVLSFRDRLVDHRGKCRAAGRALQTLRVILREAMERDVIENDPVRLVRNPAYTEQERLAVTKEDVLAMLAAPTWENEACLLAVMTAALVGMRAGELRGLRWCDLDPEGSVVQVRQQVSDLDGVKKPKWEKTRTASYPKILKKVLEPRRGKPENYVFSIVGVKPLGYKTLLNETVRAAEYARIGRLTPHGLRHSLNSALLEAGLSNEIIRASFGWSDPKIQERYTHRKIYRLDPQSEMVDDLFGGSDGKAGNDKE